MLLLASASPRRRELLANAGFDFQVFSIPVMEDPLPNEAAEPLASRLAQAKARAAYQVALDRFPGEQVTILAADTIVEVAGQILGKPSDAADAARMLRLLSGKTHRVITGVCVLSAAGEQIASETTLVQFRDITDAEISAYTVSGEPMDKAGAYAIQGRASRWVPRVEGCYFNVVGLPVALVDRMLLADNSSALR